MLFEINSLLGAPDIFFSSIHVFTLKVGSSLLWVYSSIHVFTLKVGSTLLWVGIFFHTRLYSDSRFKTALGIFFHTRLYSGGRFNTMLWVYSSIHVFTLEVGSTPCSGYIFPYTSLLWMQVQHHAPGIYFHTHLYSGGRFNTAPGIFFHTSLYSGGRFNTMLRVYSNIHVFTLEVGSTPCSGYIFPYMSLLWR